MPLRRIFQMLASFFTGQGVSIIGQLLIPPFFLKFYADGLEVYGEWIALSAAVTYLGTLNYGVQTYAANQITILYNRGEIAAAKTVQGSALRLLLSMIGVIAIAGSTFFLMPIGRWLKLTHVTSQAASLILYLLTTSVLVNMLLSLLANSYMAIRRMHRGSNWLNFQRLASTLAIVGCTWRRSPLAVLAGAQLVVMVGFVGAVLLDLRKTAPDLVPTLRYGSWAGIRPILKPSMHFGFLSLSSFLSWQGPVLLIQEILGPATVSTFSLTRTIFSMGRQGLAILSFSIGPEISLLTGRRDWPGLKRLYDLSERVVLLLVPAVTVGLLLLAPLLFALWLHKRELYDPSLCSMMAIISAVMGLKEHKYQFQSSSNQHEKLSWLTLGIYALMLTGSVFLLPAVGILGFMSMWLAAEILQVAYIVRLNVQLFPPEFTISTAPVLKFLAVLLVVFSLAAWPAFQSIHWSLLSVVAVALPIVSITLTGSYFAFDLGEVRLVLLARLRRRWSPLSSR